MGKSIYHNATKTPLRGQGVTPAISADTLDGTINTVTGIKFDMINPHSSMVNIRDITVSLSHQAHFNGQTPRFFSIAQHSVMVLNELVNDKPTAGTELKLLALLHDSPEAYTGDIIKPLKVMLPEFAAIEKGIMRAIACKFELPLNLLPEIKPYDLIVQNIEYEAFYRGGHIEYWTSEQAYDIFIAQFENLTGQRVRKPTYYSSISVK